MSSIEDEQRRGYDLLSQYVPDSPGPDGPAVFSPAASAQDFGSSSQILFNWRPLHLPYEYTSWLQEADAHTSTCYIGDWTAIGKIRIVGPDALSFFSQVGVSDLGSFPIGRIRHHVQVDEGGRVASEGVLFRVGEEEFFYSGGGTDWTMWQLQLGAWDAVAIDESAETFIFEIQGPTSIHVMERLGLSVRDLGFNTGKSVTLDGVTHRLLRTGISGELGYELHGPASAAASTWQAVVAAGAEFGIAQLGVASQLVAHIEAGIATAGIDYLPAAVVTPGGQRLVPRGPLRGSFIPMGGVTDFFRYPWELGWGARVSLDTHDFVGRDAIRDFESSGSQKRRLVGLTWNRDDVRDLLLSVYDDDAPRPMRLPREIGLDLDRVLMDGTDVGISSSRTFSRALRETISLCVVESSVSVGDEVAVLWGTAGSPQREIRALVSATPMKKDRRRTDVSALANTAAAG